MRKKKEEETGKVKGYEGNITMGCERERKEEEAAEALEGFHK